MEFLDGTDLEGALRDRGKIPLPEAVDYTLQIGEALAEAHANGIVHRDIKPANCIVVNRRNGPPLVKVLDFGIAKLTLGDAGPNLTGTQATMGTPHFMSPEQIRGAKDVDHRADIWSLGITFFQLVTGNLPFGGNTYARLVMSVSREPTPTLPNNPDLNAVLQRSLAKDRNQRYSTIGEFAAALEPFAGDREAAAALVRRCLALVPAQQLRPAGAPAAASGEPLKRTSTLPMGGAPSSMTPSHGAPPMTTPAHGAYPMTTPAHGAPPLTTPAQGAYPMTTPAHGAPPLTTPSHGAYPMTTPSHGAPPLTTPSHGAPPLTTPSHGAPPLTTPSHGAPPMTTPAHGAPPMTMPSPTAAPAGGRSKLVIAIVVLVVVAAGIAAFVLFGT
jgi:serine/threonine-protein kinase